MITYLFPDLFIVTDEDGGSRSLRIKPLPEIERGIRSVLFEEMKAKSDNPRDAVACGVRITEAINYVIVAWKKSGLTDYSPLDSRREIDLNIWCFRLLERVAHEKWEGGEQ